MWKFPLVLKILIFCGGSPYGPDRARIVSLTLLNNYQVTCRCDARETGEERCLSAHARCDSHPDCVDGTDEAGCPQNRTCLDNEFSCLDESGCISVFLRCDGLAQCADASDEAECGTCADGYTRCAGGTCVSPRYVCDGSPECPLGEDELDCPSCSDLEVGITNKQEPIYIQTTNHTKYQKYYLKK